MHLNSSFRTPATFSYHESLKAGDAERGALECSMGAHRRRPRGFVNQSLFPEVFAFAEKLDKTR